MTRIFLSLIIMAICITAKAQQPIPYPYKLSYYNFTSQQLQLQMAYMYEKPVDYNGTTVILLHGKNFCGIYWGDVMRKLLQKGYAVLVPDQIGFGESSLPKQYNYSFFQLAQNTKALADSLGIQKAIITGHSMGGMLAVRFGLMYPAFCKKIILENPIGLEDWKVYVSYSSIDEEYKKESVKTIEALKKYMTENYFHNEWKSAYDTLLYTATTQLNKTNNARNMALTSDMIFTQPVVYEFNLLNVNTTLIIGQKDRTAIGKEKVGDSVKKVLGNYPVLGAKAAKNIPGARLITIDGVGHIPHIESFDVFMNYFLKEL